MSAPNTPAIEFPNAPTALPAPEAAAPTPPPTPKLARATPTAPIPPATAIKLTASISLNLVMSSTIAVIAPETDPITVAIPFAILVIIPEIACPIAVTTPTIASPIAVIIPDRDFTTFIMTPPTIFAKLRIPPIIASSAFIIIEANPKNILPNDSKAGAAKLSANANGIIDAPSKAIAAAPIAIGPIIIPNPNAAAARIPIATPPNITSFHETSLNI